MLSKKLSRLWKSLTSSKPRRRRNPGSPFARLGADIMLLEDRCLMSVTAGIAASPTTVEQGALVSYTLTGTQTKDPPPVTVGGLFGSPGVSEGVSLGLTKIWDVEQFDGVLYVAGELNGQAAYQTFDLGGVPTAGQVHVLPNQNPNELRGAVSDVALINGAVSFVGETFIGNGHQGAVWGLSGNPTVVPTTPGDDGTLLATTPTGIVVGMGATERPAVGKIGGSMVILPNPGFFGIAASISADGKWIVGGDGFSYGLWYSNAPGSLSYALQSISLEDINGTQPDFFRDVILDPVSGHYIAFGEYTDSLTISTSVAAWDLSDGSLLRDFGVGILDDVKVIDGHVVVAMNSLEDSYVTLLDDPATVQVRSLLADGANLKSVSLAQGGFQDEDGTVSLVVQTYDNDGVGDTRLLTFNHQAFTGPTTGPVTEATFHIDWNSDGVEDQTVQGDSGVVVQHAFASAGTQTTSVWITAADGETSAPVTTSVTVTAPPEPQPASVVNGVLTVTGGDARDVVQVLPSGSGYAVSIGTFSQVLDGVHSITINSGNGNDVISITATVPVFVDAGSGNDRIAVNSPYSVVHAGTGSDWVWAFGGHAAVFGQGGNDVILSRAATSLLVGGSGNDWIFGHGRRTTIIAGDADLSPEAVDQVFSILDGHRWRLRARLATVVRPHLPHPSRRELARHPERDVVFAEGWPVVFVHPRWAFVFGHARRVWR